MTRLFSFLFLFCGTALAGRSVVSSSGNFTFGSEYQARVFRIREGVFTTFELQNKLRPAKPLLLPRLEKFRTSRVNSSEFGIHLASGKSLTAYDFAYRDHRIEQLSGGGKRLVVNLEGRTVPLDVTLTYSIQGGKPWMTKTLCITPKTEAAKNEVVEQIDVERLALPEAGERGGVGQPIFFPDISYFFGLEYPEGHNGHAGVITLSHFPGLAVGDRLESKSAVWGVAPDGQVEREFLKQYIPSFAVHYPREPVITFNEAWNSGDSTNEAISKDSISRLKKELIDGRGVKVNVYMVDGAGWADPASILAVDRTRFPGGVQPVQADAHSAGMDLGLWASLVGAELDTHWGMAHGMEAVRGHEVFGPYCLADPKYRSALKQALQHLLSQGVRSFKFDYNSFNCPQPGQNQPAKGLAAREAAVDAYIDVLKFLHDKSPDARMEITTGMWLSPWWLRYADWVWLGGSDLDFLTSSGSPSLEAKKPNKSSASYGRGREISYRDSVMWNDFRKNRYAFPNWGVMTHGFYNWLLIGHAPDPAAGIEAPTNCCNEPLADFEDHVVMVLMRGISDWEMLLNLRKMTPEKWQYLARGLKWGKAHWDELSNTQMILGNPSHFEVYGYTHFAGNHGILALRNPAAGQRHTEVTLTPENGFWDLPSKGLAARQIYPCDKSVPGTYRAGSDIEVTLRPGETKVIQLGEFSTRTETLATRSCP